MTAIPKSAMKQDKYFSQNGVFLVVNHKMLWGKGKSLDKLVEGDVDSQASATIRVEKCSSATAWRTQDIWGRTSSDESYFGLHAGFRVPMLGLAWFRRSCHVTIVRSSALHSRLPSKQSERIARGPGL
jgi:hypothetical protein